MEKKVNTIRLAKMGMLVAISIVLVSIIHIPIIPVVSFLEYDPADIPILLGTFAFGPIWGLVLTIVTSILQGLTVSAQSGIYGIVMHILATGALCVVSGSIYRYKKNKTKKHAIIGLVCGTIAMVLVMIPANIYITPYFIGAPKEAIYPLLKAIILFNFIKAGINSIVTFLVYKKVSPFLHK